MQNRPSQLLQGGFGSDACLSSGLSVQFGNLVDSPVAFRHGGTAGYLHDATNVSSVFPVLVLVHEGLETHS